MQEGQLAMSSSSSNPQQQQLSIEQLREMAARQQQQIEQQQQLLVAKEQRLKYLKQQEYQQHQMASEYDKLRRLREKVEAQEMKLRKLRALRGQADNSNANNKANNNNNNASLTNDLESIRRLFNEKEKELAMAVTKVEDLTRQLEELRNGKLSSSYPPQVVELEKLRRELAYRRQLNEQQNNMISQQRAQLTMGQEEMARIDRRIAELQDRLTRKRMMNQQLANQINAATNAKQAQLRAIQAGMANKNNKTKPVSTVEPFQRTLMSQQQQQQQLDNNHHVSAEDLKPGLLLAGGELHQQQQLQLQQQGVIDGSNINNNNNNNKNIDPKYQTLPYNTKFSQLNSHPHHALHHHHNSVMAAGSGDGAAKAQKIEQLKQEKENNNVAFAEALPRPPPPMLYGPSSRPEFSSINGGGGGGSNSAFGQGVGVVAPLPAAAPHQADSSSAAQSHLPPPPPTVKPVSSVAPVFAASSFSSSGMNVHAINNAMSNNMGGGGGIRYGTPQAAASGNMSLMTPPRLSSTPLAMATGGGGGGGFPFASNDLQRQGQASPTKLRPALPPKPVMQANNNNNNQGPQQPVHGEEGTSVDDLEDLPPPPPTSEPPSDSPTPEVGDFLNGNANNGKDMSVSVLPAMAAGLENAGGLIVTAAAAAAAATNEGGVHVSINRRIEMPPAFHFPEDEAPPSDLVSGGEYPPMLPRDVTDNAAMFPMVNQIYKEFQDLAFEEKEQLMYNRSPEESDEYSPDNVPEFESDPVASQETVGVKSIIEKSKKGALKITGKTRHNRKVSFDPLALLLDASLEGELDLVRKTAAEVADPSAANDEGITALHNAICAGHLDIVKFLVRFGCDVNAQDSDGWTPLHCAASCNNLAMVRFLVEHGACIFATTLSDHETAAEKCEEDEEGFDGCSEYLYHIQEKLGIINEGVVYSVYAYEAANADELSFAEAARLVVLRKGDEVEKEWWWSRGADGGADAGREGYVPRNLLGLYPRVQPGSFQPMEE